MTPLSDGQYAYYDPNSDIWFYLWLTSNNTVQYVERSTYSPTQMGYSVNANAPVLERNAAQEPKEGEQAEPEGAIEAENAQAEATVEAENAATDAADNAAIESYENEGGNTGPDSDSSSDSGSGGDSGGGDSGGGDSGGSGGD